MQTLIKVSNKIKWYYIKLTSPLSSFKKWLLTDLIVETKRLDDRVDMLVNQTNIDDLDNRIDNLEYDLEGRIESVEDRSETNQESIKNLKDDIRTIQKVDFAGIADRFDKIDNSIDYCKEYVVENRIENVSCETFNKLVDRVNKIESDDLLNRPLLTDFDKAMEKIGDNYYYTKSIEDRLNNETSTKKIREIVAEVLCDKGLSLNLLDDRIDNLEELAKKYLNAELQSVVLKGPQYFEGKQERTEANLSAMQKLSFEICMGIFGDFNLDDFNNCYEIINKYNVEEVK